MMPARVKSGGDGPVVPGIMINIAVLGIETVIAFPGAALAPAPTLPRRPDMPGVRPGTGFKIRCAGRSTHAAGSNHRQCGREDQPFHGADRNTPLGRWQITPAGLVKHRSLPPISV